MKIDVQVVNAFVSNKKGGNPAGVVLDASKLTERQMQKVAAVVGASETVFVLPSSSATHTFRFFTPTQEVNLCGHATVACWSLMNKLGFSKTGNYTQETHAGTIKIEIDAIGRVFIQMPTGKVGKYFDPEIVKDGLGIKKTDLSKELPPRFMGQDLMICLSSETVLDGLHPDSSTLSEISKKYEFYDFHVFVLKNGNEVFAQVRNFCPILGIPEDAATGTTNGNFLSYLKQLNTLPDKPDYIIEQGKVMGRTSKVIGKFIDGQIWIGGTAIDSKQIRVEI